MTHLDRERLAEIERTLCHARKYIADGGPLAITKSQLLTDIDRGIGWFRAIIADLSPTPQEDTMKHLSENQIKYMVERFLGWKLPKNFNPDAGISFKADFNEHTAYPMKHEPVGTNLFDADQAKTMVIYMIEGMPAAPAPPPGDEVLIPWHDHYGVQWLQELCNAAGKGVLENADARSVWRTVEGLGATIDDLTTSVATLTRERDEALDRLCPRHSVAPYRICTICHHGGDGREGGWPVHAADCPVRALSTAQREVGERKGEG